MMSMLDSPLPPYMYEDQVHVQWLSLLQKSHAELFQQWEQVCTTAESYIAERTIRINGRLPKLLLSDLYRSLETSLLPCDDTLNYGVTYPIIGTGLEYTTAQCKSSTVLGYVHLKDCSISCIHIFARAADEYDESASPMFADDDDDDDPTTERVPLAGDTGCDEEHYAVDTVDIFDVLRKRNLIVLPLIARPSAVLYKESVNRYGTLEFNVSTGQCYNAVNGRYALRLACSLEASIDNECLGADDIMWLNPIEVEESLLRVPTTLLVNTRGFDDIDGTHDPRLPTGSHNKTVLKCLLWYPHGEDDYIPGNV
jgi:hypothetical protein